MPVKAMMPLANPPHMLDPTPILKALFTQLQDWALSSVPPTPSQVPRRSDGTAVARESVIAAFLASVRPDATTLPWLPKIDPERVEWPVSVGEPLTALVSVVDDAGKETAGSRLPSVETGVAAYTGWNPRRRIDGLPDVIYDLLGSRLPTLSKVAAPTSEDFRAATQRLVDRRLLLPEDIDDVVDHAGVELAAATKAMLDASPTNP